MTAWVGCEGAYCLEDIGNNWSVFAFTDCPKVNPGAVDVAPEEDWVLKLKPPKLRLLGCNIPNVVDDVTVAVAGVVVAVMMGEACCNPNEIVWDLSSDFVLGILSFVIGCSLTAALFVPMMGFTAVVVRELKLCSGGLLTASPFNC